MHVVFECMFSCLINLSVDYLQVMLLLQDRNAVGDRRRLWPNGIVPYEISSYFSKYKFLL